MLWKWFSIIIWMSLLVRVTDMQTTDIGNHEELQGTILFSRLNCTGAVGTYTDPGDIYTLDLANNRRVRLSEDNLCCATSWSPDGSRILVHQVHANGLRPPTLWIIDDNIHSRFSLAIPGNLLPDAGEWLPDGSQIIFWANNTQAEFRQPRWAIYSAPLNGESIVRLTQPTTSGNALTISPDGSQIAFEQEGNLYLMSLQDGEPYFVELPFQNIRQLAWSPDGSRIAINVNYSEIYSITPAGDDVRLHVADMETISQMRWSPNRPEPLFIGGADSDSEATLGIIHLETNVIEVLRVNEGLLTSISNIISARWSPNGAYFALSASVQEEHTSREYDIHIVDRNLSQIQRLTHTTEPNVVVDWK